MTYKPIWKTFFELGKKDFYSSNYNSAIRYFNQALLNNPRNKNNYCFIYIYCGCSYYFLGDHMTSINYFRNGLIEDESTSRLPLFLLINNLLNKSDFNNLKALNNLLKIAQNLFSENREIIIEDEMIILYWTRACIYKNLNENKCSLIYYSKAISLIDNERSDYEKKYWNVNLLTSRSKVYMNKRDYKAAINDINLAILLFEDYEFHAPYLHAGEVYRNLGIYNISISMFSKAIDCFPENNPWESKIIFAYINRGYLRIKIGNIEDAIDDFEFAYTINKKCFKKYQSLIRHLPEGVKNIIRTRSQIQI